MIFNSSTIIISSIINSMFHKESQNLGILLSTKSQISSLLKEVSVKHLYRFRIHNIRGRSPHFVSHSILAQVRRGRALGVELCLDFFVRIINIPLIQ